MCAAEVPDSFPPGSDQVKGRASETTRVSCVYFIYWASEASPTH